MATPRNGAYVRLAVVGVLVLIATLFAASAAQAAVSISRAELGGTQLRIEGQAAANRTITVDGVAMGTSDGSGRFRIERPPSVTVASGATRATLDRKSTRLNSSHTVISYAVFCL